MTIDGPLLEEVDRLIAMLDTSRSAFIRDALQAAIRKYTIAALEKQDARGYALYPMELDEVGMWLTEQVWPEE